MQNSSTALAIAGGARFRFIDFLRALASQLIVWHHLAFYGPLSDIAYPLAPLAIDVLYDYARMAVQVFLVIGGFLTAQQLAHGTPVRLAALRSAVARRYRRIGLPYLATLVVAIFANALADRWMDHPSISGPPSVIQFIAHAVFAQDIFNFEALSAGIWYLAIDFQLFILSFLLVAGANFVAAKFVVFGRLSPFRVLQGLTWPLALLSLYWINRDPEFDCWALYFFGSYFFGMVLCWTINGALPRQAFWIYALAVALAIVVDWRPRLVVASATACLLMIAARKQFLRTWPRSPVIAYFGKISYSLFLIHFPICLLTNAWFSRWPLSPLQSFGGMVVAYLTSLLGAVAFYNFIEVPCLKFASRAPTRSPPDALVRSL